MYINFAANRSLLHLPYIVRFTILSLLLFLLQNHSIMYCPLNFQQHQVFSQPVAKRAISFNSEALYFSMYRYNSGISFFSYISQNPRMQVISSLIFRKYALWLAASSAPILRNRNSPLLDIWSYFCNFFIFSLLQQRNSYKPLCQFKAVL